MTNAQPDRTPEVASKLTTIEHAQSPDRQGGDALTIAELMGHFRVPSLSIAVIQDFKVDQAMAWGLADVDTGRPATDGTLYQAASISKPVAAMASLKAVQTGLFGLDQDVNSILQSWKLPGTPFGGGPAVTPRMLMSHTSGTGDGFGFGGYKPGAPLPTTRQVLDGEPPSAQSAVRLVRPALTSSHYSGGAVEIQRLALTDTVGMPFVSLMHDWVLAPLGMTNSTYEQPLPDQLQAQAARGHDGDGQREGQPWYVYAEQAAAGLWTTPTDLARFVIDVQLTLAGRSTVVLDRPTVQNMVTPVGVGPYAVGFMITQKGQGWYFEHGGSNWGFQSYVVGHLAKGYGAAIMTNGNNGSVLASEVLERISRAYGWDSLDKPVLR